ncbi:MAG: Hpt domain-containing protein, partial [Bdellovibrionia bacterium]
MDDFEAELKKIFLEEAEQGVAEAERYFLELDRNPGDRAVLEGLFRIAHNLKGSSGACGFRNLSLFTHELESLLFSLKSKGQPVNIATVNLLLRCNDFLLQTVLALKNNPEFKGDDDQLLGEIKKAIQRRVEVPEVATENSSSSFQESSLAQEFLPAEEATPAQEFLPAEEATPTQESLPAEEATPT